MNFIFWKDLQKGILPNAKSLFDNMVFCLCMNRDQRAENAILGDLMYLIRKWSIFLVFLLYIMSVESTCSSFPCTHFYKHAQSAHTHVCGIMWVIRCITELDLWCEWSQDATKVHHHHIPFQIYKPVAQLVSVSLQSIRGQVMEPCVHLSDGASASTSPVIFLWS